MPIELPPVPPPHEPSAIEMVEESIRRITEATRSSDPATRERAWQLIDEALDLRKRIGGVIASEQLELEFVAEEPRQYTFDAEEPF